MSYRKFPLWSDQRQGGWMSDLTFGIESPARPAPLTIPHIMISGDPKQEMMRQQVNSKILWGTRDEEVLEWLSEKHGIQGAEADRLLAEAYRSKRIAVRRKACMSLIFASLGIVLSAAAFYVRNFNGTGVYIIGGPTILAGAIGITGIGVFFRSLARLLTGKTPGSVD